MSFPDQGYAEQPVQSPSAQWPDLEPGQCRSVSAAVLSGESASQFKKRKCHASALGSCLSRDFLLCGRKHNRKPDPQS